MFFLLRMSFWLCVLLLVLPLGLDGKSDGPDAKDRASIDAMAALAAAGATVSDVGGFCVAQPRRLRGRPAGPSTRRRTRP